MKPAESIPVKIALLMHLVWNYSYYLNQNLLPGLNIFDFISDSSSILGATSLNGPLLILRSDDGSNKGGSLTGKE